MIDLYLEVGRQRTFAAALDWPGWARSGRDEESAQRALVEYGQRYRTAMGAAAAGLRLPANASDVRVVETMPGDATTDFGAPGAIPSADWQPIGEAELERLIGLLRAAWQAFELAADAAEGVELATGPRGGGRSLAKIREHVAGADASYARQLGGRPSEASWAAIQAAVVDSLWARLRGEVPDTGPRGGTRWPPRFALRRSAWHALDHAWEIEERAILPADAG